MRARFLIVLLLAGCSLTPTKTVQLPDGTPGVSIDCSWSGKWASCMNKAAKLCGHYKIVSQGASSGGGMLIPAGTAAVYAASEVKEMIVQCEK